MKTAACMLMLVGSAASQQLGTLKQEQHPSLTVSKCSKSGGCQDQQKSVVIDSNWRWTHQVGQPKNCYTGNKWDQKLCPDAETCTKNCALEGAAEEYENTYGVKTDGKTLSLQFVTQGPYSKNIGSRLYLLDDEETYLMFKLKNQEFTFDVDVSQLPCGLNGALYFVQMDSDGGMAKHPSNKCGAKLGTGYCDAQCPHDMKWINGEANMKDWKPSPTDPNSGHGKYGTCCTEFDVWEANTMGMAYTAHACNTTGAYRCSGATECGDNGETRFEGVCDKNGCDFQTYRLGDKTFYGKGSDFQVDTTKPITVVTQFITDDNTESGNLVEVRRFYVQDGKKIATPSLSVGGKKYDSLTKDFCEAEVALFKDHTNFLEKGGFKATGDAFDKGMVLALSLWDDHYANMLWLDSTYPVGGTAPGNARGPCSTDSGKPSEVEQQSGSATVKYMNIRYGDIGSTTQ